MRGLRAQEGGDACRIGIVEPEHVVTVQILEGCHFCSAVASAAGDVLSVLHGLQEGSVALPRQLARPPIWPSPRRDVLLAVQVPDGGDGPHRVEAYLSQKAPNKANVNWIAGSTLLEYWSD